LRRGREGRNRYLEKVREKRETCDEFGATRTITASKKK